jgi:hypothetical protein
VAWPSSGFLAEATSRATGSFAADPGQGLIAFPPAGAYLGKLTEGAAGTA